MVLMDQQVVLEIPVDLDRMELLEGSDKTVSLAAQVLLESMAVPEV